MKDVHTEHCCIKHGCKYGDENCTVTTGKEKQSYTCEDCDYDGITSVDQLYDPSGNTEFKRQVLEVLYDLTSAITDIDTRILLLEDYGTPINTHDIYRKVWKLQSILGNGDV